MQVFDKEFLIFAAMTLSKEAVENHIYNAMK